MSIQQYFDVNELFNPSMFYTGEITLGNISAERDLLVLNAKSKSGKNRYLDFAQKYYFDPLAKILNSQSLAHGFNPVISLTHTEDGKRVSHFSFLSFVMGKVLGSTDPQKYVVKLQELGNDVSNEDLNIFLKNMQREQRRLLEDVYYNWKGSPHFGTVFSLYREYVNQAGPNMTFADFTHGMMSGAQKTTMATRNLIPFFEQDINTEELLRCFDYDKFCLVAAYSILEMCRLVESSSNLVHNSAIYITKYMEAVETLRAKNPKYDCTIRIYDEEKGKIRTCNIDEVIEEYRAILARHPEFRRYHISLDRVYELLRMYNYDEDFIANFDPKTNDSEIIMGILQKIEDNKALLASWNIIPKGKSERSEPLPEPTDPRMPLEEKEKIRRMIISKSYLENSAYLFILEGINEFEGYQGYLYPNGIVIFEKYYDNIKTKKVASGSATYVMNLNNFVEVSKLTKTEIISKINKGEVQGVRRIFHRADMERWKSEVTQAITGSDYSIQVEQYIDELLETKQVSKKGVKQ